MSEAKFKITDGKGFHITFENGVTASVRFGYGNYCANYFDDNARPWRDGKVLDGVECKNAEVAAWRGDQWITSEVWAESDGEVAGYLSPNEVLEFMVNCANYRG